jgi:ABC-type branched-subunit amino acid transport system substrate-binding protein
MYTDAKTELKNKNFEKAMELFKKAAVDKPDNAYKVNAMYFYAYCALKLKMYWSVSHYLTKILDKYPEWYKIDEVYYLQAQMAFEKKEYANACANTKKIKSIFLRKDISNMEWNFLYFPSLKDTVMVLQKQYPMDTTMATILYCLIKDDSGWKNKKLIKSLVEDYKLEPDSKKEQEKDVKEDPTKQAMADSIPKDTLNIAVVLPFNLWGNIQDNSIKNDQYVFDLYTGIRLAHDSLKRLGSKIRLVCYDYGKDSIGYYNLIDNPELRQYDLVIGPLQNSLGAKAAEFADTSRTMVINPLSYNSKFMMDTNYVYLFKPSVETQTKEAASFAYSYFKPKKAIIFTSKSAKDSLAALLFQKTFEKAGGKILSKQTLTAGTLGKLNSTFTSKTLDSTGFIFVSTRDQYLGVNIVRKLIELDRTTPLLVYSDWMDFQTISFEQMQKQNIHFIYPDFINKNNDSTQAIGKYLQKRTNCLPSDYTFTGFELMWQIGQLWKNKGALQLPIFLKKLTYRPGLIFKGLDLSQSNDNKCLTIYHFTSEGFREAKLSP